MHTPLRSVHTKLKEAISLGFSEYTEHEIYRRKEIYRIYQKNSLLNSRLQCCSGCSLEVELKQESGNPEARFLSPKMPCLKVSMPQFTLCKV